MGPSAKNKERERFGFFSFFLNSFLSSHFQIQFEKQFKFSFRLWSKTTHLKNKMHQHDLHAIVAKSYDKFYFKEKYYFSYIFMSTKMQN